MALNTKTKASSAVVMKAMMDSKKRQAARAAVVPAPVAKPAPAAAKPAVGVTSSPAPVPATKPASKPEVQPGFDPSSDYSGLFEGSNPPVSKTQQLMNEQQSKYSMGSFKKGGSVKKAKPNRSARGEAQNKGYKEGGSVAKGTGCAIRGTRKCKMY